MRVQWPGSVRAHAQPRDTALLAGYRQLAEVAADEERRQLLHAVERTMLAMLLSDPAYARCPCPYCRPLFSGAAWSHEYAGLHYLFNAGNLTAEVVRDS